MNLWGSIIYFAGAEYCVIKPTFLTQDTLATLYQPEALESFKHGRIAYSSLRTIWSPTLEDFGDIDLVLNALLTLLKRIHVCFLDQDDPAIWVFPDHLPPQISMIDGHISMTSLQIAYEVDYLPDELVGVIITMISRELYILRAARAACVATVSKTDKTAYGILSTVHTETGRWRIMLVGRAISSRRPLAVQLLMRLVGATREALSLYPGIAWIQLVKACNVDFLCNDWIDVPQVQHKAQEILASPISLAVFQRTSEEGIDWDYFCGHNFDWRMTLESAGLRDPDGRLGAVSDFDVFISHAGEQKGNFACHIQTYLRSAGVSCFLDEVSMMPGDRASEVMREQAQISPICIAVLSAEYFASVYCREELEIFLARRNAWLAQNPTISPRATTLPCIIPVYYNVDPSGVVYDPGLKHVPVRSIDRTRVPASVESYMELFNSIKTTGVRRDQHMLESVLIGKLVDTVKLRLSDLK